MAANSNAPVITISDLALTYPGADAPVLARFDLAVAKGELVAIVGASGVGKSTLLRVLIGLMAPSAGGLSVATKADPTRLPLAMVFQESRLLPWRRVLANVAFGLDRLAVSKADAMARARAALDLVGLGHLADRFPHQLSGGQRQRVAIARALAVEPEILLMDEPFSALDAITRATLQDELLRLRAATGKTILFVTHDIDEAVYLADRVVVLAGSPAGITATLPMIAPHPRARNSSDQQSAVEAVKIGLGLEGSQGEGI